MSKYGSVKAKRGQITFDSQKEAARYDELMLQLRAGEIQNLKLQPEFTLKEAFRMPDGARSGPVKYRADFSYEKPVREGAGTRMVRVIEDVKGFKTKEYALKKKFMEEHGFQITEV